MIIFPHSKINLGLRILRKRTDGYHDLETIFYPIPLCDALEVVEGNKISEKKCALITEGLKVAGDSDDNLILKAYRLLDHDFHLPATTFCLLKTIPMGAGLGGGSSDGAFAIRLLNSYYSLGLSREKMIAYASQLGSDCAFFIQDQPCFGLGRGELLQPCDISLSGYWLVLIKPSIHVSTAEAFSKITPKENTPSNEIMNLIQGPVESWKDKLVNDFEASVFPIYPELKRIKEILYEKGAVYASMSGSGSSIFGLFKQPMNLKKEFEKDFYFESLLR